MMISILPIMLPLLMTTRSDMDKKEIRSKYKKMRDELFNSPDHAKICKDISDNITGSRIFKNSDILLVFLSFGSEFDTSYLIKSALLLDKKVFIPKVKGTDMIFYPYDEKAGFTVSSYGILEPKESQNDLISYIKAGKRKLNILNIAPALCADKDFYRLGYGGGFYDRFLSDLINMDLPDISITSLVPIYSGFITEKLPHDDNDIKAEMIVTEKKGDIRELQRD